MLDGYGLHALIWNLADQVVSDILVASPMDAQGRGIALEAREAGVAADLEGATAFLVWTHRGTGKRGTTEFEAVAAAVGKFSPLLRFRSNAESPEVAEEKAAALLAVDSDA